MPTLSIEGDDHHFIIKTKTYEQKFQSWQVTDRAIQFLKQKGIEIPRSTGDKITFDKHLLTKMIDQRLVYIKGSEPHSSNIDDDELNAEQRLDLIFCENVRRSGWDLAVAARKVPGAWRASGIAAARQNCVLLICDPYTTSNRTQRVLSRWTLSDILANKPCVVKPITGRYIVEAQGYWPSGYSVQKWIHNFRGMDVEGTLFHDRVHDGWRVAAHEVIYPGRTYYLVAPSGKTLLKEVNPRLLTTLSAESPYPALRKWQAWSITIPQIYYEVTYGRLREWFGQMGYSFRELPWRLALISPPPVYYTPEGIPVLEQGQDVIVEVLPPTEPVQGAESTEIQVKRDNGLCFPLTSKIRSHCFLTFPLHQPGAYLINGVNGLTRPLNFTVITKNQKYALATPQALQVTVKTKENVHQFNAFAHDLSTPQEHIVDIDTFEAASLPQFQISCPVPLDLTWTFGNDRECHWQVVEPTSLLACLQQIVQSAWEKHETVSLCLDAGAFGKLAIKIVLRKTRISPSVSAKGVAHTGIPDSIQQRLQWLLEQLAAENRYGTQTVIPSTIQKRLNRLKSVPECTIFAQYKRVPLVLLPYLVALTTILEREMAPHFSSIE